MPMSVRRLDEGVIDDHFEFHTYALILSRIKEQAPHIIVRNTNYSRSDGSKDGRCADPLSKTSL